MIDGSQREEKKRMLTIYHSDLLSARSMTKFYYHRNALFHIYRC